MSSFGTAKVQTDSLNLGFPVAYEDVYAEAEAPTEYMPMRRRPEPVLPAGGDFQAMWHHQKMLDANHMANAKVQATNLSRVRAFSSPHGYWQMPPPVLGQRKFANPSYGSGPTDIYTARPSPFNDPHIGAGLVGGVLRTPAGQAYGVARLKARIAQLNAIASAKAGFDIGSSEDVFAGAEPTFQDELGQIPQIELAITLDNILRDVTYPGNNGDRLNRYTAQDTAKAIAQIIRLSTTGSADEISNILEFIDGSSTKDGIAPLMKAMADEAQQRVFQWDTSGTTDTDETRLAWLKWINTLTDVWAKISTYVRQMLPLASRGTPAKDRQARSKALISSLQLNKRLDAISRFVLPSGARNDIDYRYGNNFTLPSARYNANNSVAPDGRNMRQGEDFNQLIGYGGDYERPSVRENYKNPLRREDSEHGYWGDGPARYSQDERQVFAYNSGEYQDNTGGRPRGFFGEQPAEYADAVSALNAVNNTALTTGTQPGAEQGTLASKVAPGGNPNMSSTQNADGSYDIKVQRQKNEEAMNKARGDTKAQEILYEEEEEEVPDEEEEVAMEQADELFPQTSEEVKAEEEVTSKRPKEPPVSETKQDKERKQTFREEQMAMVKALAPEDSCPPAFGGGKKYKAKDIPKDPHALMEFIGKLHKKHKGYSQAVYAKKDMNVANVRRNTMKKLKGAGLM